MRTQVDEKTVVYATGDPDLSTARPDSHHARYRVYRERDQQSPEPDSRSWADYLGPARADETRPVLITPSWREAVGALLWVMADASMGGHRYGRIEIAGHVVATVTRGGRIRVTP
jgi:hypothetical protein